MKSNFLPILQYDAMPYDAIGKAAGAGVQQVVGEGEAIYGLINAKKLKKQAAAIDARRPMYNISPYAGQDVALAESNLSNGMSAEANQAYKEGVDKNFASSLSAILKGGGTPNTVSGVFGNAEEGLKNLAMLKESNRMAKMNNLVQEHQYYNDQLDKQWTLNKKNPWEDEKSASTAAREKNSALLMNGLDTFGAGVINAVGGHQATKTLNDYLAPTPQVASTNVGGGEIGNVARQDARPMISDSIDWKNMGDGNVSAPLDFSNIQPFNG